MKIGLIYHQFTRAGGLENYLIEFATQLVARGHEVHALTAKTAPDVEARLGVTWHRVPRPPTAIGRLWQFDRVARKALPVDVTIGFGRTTTHDFHRAGGGCHALYSRLLPWWKRYTPKNLLELSLERQLYTAGRTRTFITNSSQVSRELQAQYAGITGPCRVIHTAVDSTAYRPAEDRAAHRQRICKMLELDASKPLALFVSLSHRRKGLDTLLRAWQPLDATLLIAGRPLDSRYNALIAQHNLERRVRVLPPRTDLVQLYQAADWFVHPTLYDACANTVLQSMASGLPGVISVNDGATDHVQDGVNGLLLREPQSADALTERLASAFALPEEQRLAMGEAARATMLPHTWEAHVNAWLKVIGAEQP